VQTQRFAVEFDRRTVGIAVRVPGGFMFFASSDRFAALDGRLFSRARALERALNRHAKSGRCRSRPLGHTAAIPPPPQPFTTGESI
jgi:hypothetical protein